MKEIIIGFYNLSLNYFREKGHPVERLAKVKLKICDECPLRVKAEKEGKSGMHCPSCGCYLPAKARSGSDCPEKLWPSDPNVMN